MDKIFNYYYLNEVEEFIFYRIPKFLFLDSRFSCLSCEAKMLYSLMLDRVGISIKNNWVDNCNRIYIYFTIKNVMEYIGCGHDKAAKLLSELDENKGIGLIERKRQGLGKPDIIYVKKVILKNQVADKQMQIIQLDAAKKPMLENQSLCVQEKDNEKIDLSEISNSGNQNFNNQEISSQDCCKLDSNNTDNTNNNVNNIDIRNLSIYQEIKDKKQIDRLDMINTYREIVKKNIYYDVLCIDYGKEYTDEILELIVDTICSSSKTCRISGSNLEIEVVKSRFLKLNMFHIQYVFYCMKRNVKKVHNIKNYLLTALYNSSFTMKNFYNSEVNYDMYG